MEPSKVPWQEALWSSKDQTHETPSDMFDALHSRFNFQVDLAAIASNAKVPEYLGPDREEENLRDSLALPWNAVDGWLWLNHPYGKTSTPRWSKKCLEESKRGAKICSLVPCRTDTKAWHLYARHADLRVEIEGRLTFEGSENGAPFPSGLLFWCGKNREPRPIQEVMFWKVGDDEALDQIRDYVLNIANTDWS